MYKSRRKNANVKNIMRIAEVVEFAISNTLGPSLGVDDSAYDVDGATSKPRPRVKSHQNSTVSYVNQV